MELNSLIYYAFFFLQENSFIDKVEDGLIYAFK